MMADKNRRKTACDDSGDDGSGDKWFVPNDKMGEYEDEGGIGEDSDQSFTMWSRPPIEEDCDIDNTESVAEGGTGEASGQDDMQSFTIWSRPPSEENCYIDNTESVAEGGTDEASGQDDMQSFDKWSPPPSEKDCNIDTSESVFLSLNMQSQKKEEQIKLEVRRTYSHHMQSSSDNCSPPRVEDTPIGWFQAVGRILRRLGSILSRYVSIFKASISAFPKRCAEYCRTVVPLG